MTFPDEEDGVEGIHRTMMVSHQRLATIIKRTDEEKKKTMSMTDLACGPSTLGVWQERKPDTDSPSMLEKA